MLVWFVLICDIEINCQKSEKLSEIRKVSQNCRASQGQPYRWCTIFKGVVLHVQLPSILTPFYVVIRTVDSSCEQNIVSAPISRPLNFLHEIYRTLARAPCGTAQYNILLVLYTSQESSIFALTAFLILSNSTHFFINCLCFVQ